MTEQDQAKFEGYAIVDVLGKQRYVGYVKTETYGTAAMFRVDVPSLPEREYVLDAPQYVDGTWTPAGSTVKRSATLGYTKLIGSNSIYMISPCDEAAAIRAIEVSSRSEMKVIKLADGPKKLGPAHYDSGDGEEEEEEEE